MSSHTYGWEVERARNRMREAVRDVGDGFWEKVQDEHTPGVIDYSIWADDRGEYVAEVTRREKDVDYIVLTDPRLGDMIADLLDAVLVESEGALGQRMGHDECDPKTCIVGAAVRMARRINEEPE